MTEKNNPLLEDFELPAFSAIRPEHINPAIDQLLSQYRQRVDQLIDGTDAGDFTSVMVPLEALAERLGRAWAPIGHLHGVKDSPELREAYNAAQEKLTDHNTELGQNRALFEAVEAVHQSAEFQRLDRAQRALVEDALREFRLSGVALEEPQRSRFKAIQTELSSLATGFSEAVLDATDSWTRPVTEDELAGLPDSARALLAQSGSDTGQGEYAATLKGPIVQAILTYAENRDLRQAVYTAYHTRASDQGPDAGRFDNSERIERILALNHESAQLLGFQSAAHLSLDDKMAGTPERVMGFLRELVGKARPVAERELAELRAFAAAQLAIDDLQPWDIGFASERLRQHRFDFSEEDLKPYFPLPSVIDGLLAIANRVFGLQFREHQGVDVWHPDARYFDVIDADDSVRAGFYIDLYARSGKRGGAWMDVCRERFCHDGRRHRPVAFLICNFAPPAGERPALLTHDDVLTLFHEFGHGLHHLLTEVDWPGIGGISGVEWDAVELPSQFMENFCWQRETLDLFARHWQTGEPLPDSLHHKMLAARHFHAGLFLVRQLELALFDFRLHLEYDPSQGGRVLEILQQVRAEVAVIEVPDWHRLAHAFGHIFAGGYAAGYYSYLWAEVLSADAFAAFEEAGLLDAATGERYRREILAVGGSRPALDSFIAFRGREPDPAALLRSYGLAA